jgi:ABC-type Na+ efflux pump permease subunit
MNPKVWTVALREFNAGVRTKTFIIGIVMLPLLMSMGLIVGQATQNIRDVRDRKFAVIDRTGANLGPDIAARAAARNERAIFDSNGKQTRPKYLFEVVPPPADPKALEQVRFDLSERVRKEELAGFFEIGPNVILPKLTLPSGSEGAATQPVDFEKLDARQRDELVRSQQDNFTRFATNRTTDMDPNSWFSSQLSELVVGRRAMAAGMSAERVTSLSIPVLSLPGSLTEKDPVTGALREAAASNPIAAFIAPFGIAMLMFSTVVVAATPLMHGLVEEKQQRIAEVLLSSARPFDILLGKLIGNAGVCLVLAAVYLGGAYFAANKWGFAQYMSPTLIAWFVVFQILAVLMYGSLFVAIGAACTEIKEIQNLFTPVMLLLVLPIAALGNIIQNPAGPLAGALTFVPTAAPVIVMARLALNPPPPLWQVLTSIVLCLLTTLAFVWAAGRIFRVGMLVQGKGAKPTEILKWLVRG